MTLPPCENVANVMKPTLVDQLELGMQPPRDTTHPPRNHRRERARWWFDRMKTMVRMAASPAPLPPPQPTPRQCQFEFKRPASS